MNLLSRLPLLVPLTLAIACGGSQGTDGATADPPAEGSSTVGRACGSRALGPCGAGEFCEFPIEAMCGAADHPGVCAEITEVCTRELRPVCGCDDRTYPNHCQARAAGVSIRASVACAEADANTDAPAARGETGPGCQRGGCAGELCFGADDEPMASICMVRPTDACYQAATCAQQADGACGFTQTPELQACLANPPTSAE